MDIITVRFTTKWPPNPTSPIIARLAGSTDISHSMNIIDGLVYQATMIHGCQARVPLDEAMDGVAMYQDMYVPVPDREAAIKFGDEQDGKGYDFAGAFGIPLLMSQNWADWRKWWCSEINFMQIGMGGTWMLDKSQCKRVTPTHLRMCNYPKSGIIRIR